MRRRQTSSSCSSVWYLILTVPPFWTSWTISTLSPSAFDRFFSRATVSASFCCGAGGGGFLMEETGTRISHIRIDELMQAKPDTIAASCPFCVLMLEDALKAKNLADKVKVKDISEMI